MFVFPFFVPDADIELERVEVLKQGETADMPAQKRLLQRIKTMLCLHRREAGQWSADVPVDSHSKASVWAGDLQLKSSTFCEENY